MALQGGNNVANYVVQSRLTVGTTGWTALQVGSAPHSGRFQVRLFVRGNPGYALALAYANQNADGTFTTPTATVRDVTVFPGGRTWVEPISDRVTVYGRLLKKAGATDNSVAVVVTEFS